MFIVSPGTVLNDGALEMRNAPKRMIGRIAILPRRGASFRTVMRIVFEIQLLRYLLPLLPLVVAMLIWPSLALPIAQAPLPMFLIIILFEMRVLAYKKEARPGLIDDDDMARGLDAFRFNAGRILTRIAAMRNLTEGEILLVVEQSELARVPPLTLVSVQEARPDAQVLDLSEEERALIEEGLFDDQLTEKRLHLIALRESENLRTVALDVATISAHARMAALTEGAPAPPPA